MASSRSARDGPRCLRLAEVIESALAITSGSLELEGEGEYRGCRHRAPEFKCDLTYLQHVIDVLSN